MLEVTALGWGALTGLVVALLALDVVVAARRTRPIALRGAAVWSIFYIVVALAFGLVLAAVAGWGFAEQYFAGYVVEKSLSVDNLFVFVIIMSTFAVPNEHQQKVLTLGIGLALVLRSVFIALGAVLIDAFSFMFLIFGLALLMTAVHLFRHRAVDHSMRENPLVALARRTLPFSNRYDSGRFTSRRDGRRVLTPLALVLVIIGSTDVLFALDSIPAIFGVSQEPFIVFAANAFALLGLRALFFLIGGLLDRLVYLSTGLSLILAFIGLKLIGHFAHHQVSSFPEISTATSLLVIVIILALTTAASVIKSRRGDSRGQGGGSGETARLRQAGAKARTRGRQGASATVWPCSKSKPSPTQ